METIFNLFPICNDDIIDCIGYKTHEIAELLGLQGNGEKHAEYVVANHINKFLTYFCNSDEKRDPIVSPNTIYTWGNNFRRTRLKI